MAASTDLLLQNNDLQFKDGDFLIGASDEQHIEHILVADKGNFRAYPLLGIGLLQYVNSPTNTVSKTELKGKIKRQLEYDGYNEVFVQINSVLDINIQAQRIQ